MPCKLGFDGVFVLGMRVEAGADGRVFFPRLPEGTFVKSLLIRMTDLFSAGEAPPVFVSSFNSLPADTVAGFATGRRLFVPSAGNEGILLSMQALAETQVSIPLNLTIRGDNRIVGFQIENSGLLAVYDGFVALDF